MSPAASRRSSASWRAARAGRARLLEAPRAAVGRRCRGPQLAGGALARRAPGARAGLAGVAPGLRLGCRCRRGRRMGCGHGLRARAARAFPAGAGRSRGRRPGRPRRALAVSRRGSGGTLALAPASEACAALGRRREQRAAVLEREGLGVAVLRYLGVLLAIGDVRSVAAVEHLDAFGGEVLDDAIGVRLLLQAYHLERPLERHGVRVVLLQRGVLAAVLHVRAETPDVGDDGFALRGLPELARPLEQLPRVGERDRIHLLPRAQAREPRLLLVVLG